MVAQLKKYLVSTVSNNIITTNKPYWGIRGFSHHTQHPLELMYYLNGIGPLGENDIQGFQHGMKLVELWAEWLIARKQNRAQWLLLDIYTDNNSSNNSFTKSLVRQERLLNISKLFHDYGISCGPDVPIVFTQENSMTLVDPKDKSTPVEVQINNTLKYLMNCGFDFIASESGYSEFTHGSDELMLHMMNVAGNILKTTYDSEYFMKVHISSDQYCKHFKDPRTNDPLNFNFLPMFANTSVSVYPHTVQIYSFNDPTGMSYGQANFSFMLDWLMYVAGNDRKVVYKPETAYWGNYDISVPLFLPIYP